MNSFSQNLFTLLLFLYSSYAHKCIHDEYLRSHNTTTTVSPQSYLDHPFELTQEDRATARRQLKKKRKHAESKETKWEPMRIHLDSSDLAKHTYGSDGKATLDKILSSIFPATKQILSKYLSVVRVNGNLKVTRPCRYTFSGGPDAGKKCCGLMSQCTWDANACDGIAVPDSHATSGIANTDFVVYLTANEDFHGDTMAHGITCRTDQYDRPTAGGVTINLDAWKSSFSKNYMISVLTHEISHALGWSANSFSKFRDEHGNLRSNVITSKNALDKTISILNTPFVTSQVRSHFGCNSLTGMEIEDQGGSGTAGSHPEKRIFPESYMAGISGASSQHIIDRIALSIFQDSGWYKVTNLNEAGRLSFGRGMGCRVPTHKCNDWGQEANARGLFCKDRMGKYCTGNQLQQTGNCDLAHYTSDLPPQFRYFSSATTGASTQIADFCPSVKPYSNGDCTDTKNNNSPSLVQAQGVYHGSDARCFRASLCKLRWNCQKSSGWDAMCYRRTCTANHLQIHVGDEVVNCPVSEVSSSRTLTGYTGSIVCPPYSGLSDVRCKATCSADDPECLGTKGEAADLKGTYALPSDNAPVVVSGRNLRH